VMYELQVWSRILSSDSLCTTTLMIHHLVRQISVLIQDDSHMCPRSHLYVHHGQWQQIAVSVVILLSNRSSFLAEMGDTCFCCAILWFFFAQQRSLHSCAGLLDYELTLEPWLFSTWFSYNWFLKKSCVFFFLQVSFLSSILIGCCPNLRKTKLPSIKKTEHEYKQ
jgi:hypothetical protein